jgi:TonB family protein
MREPSLQKTTALSFVLHLTAFLIAVLVLKQSDHIVFPSPYTVSLVGPDVLERIERGRNMNAPNILKNPVGLSNIPKKNVQDIVKYEDMVEGKINAIAAKKKIEKIIRLRSSISTIIPLKSSGDNLKVNAQTAANSMGKGTIFSNYYSKIRKEIWQQWVFPDTGKKDLEAIVSIRILKDGTIISQRIEKSSGNPLFDRSAIKALAKASPLPPPPYEMDIGVRFYP